MRLALALMVSFALHGLVMSTQFTPVNPRLFEDLIPPIEVVLVNAKTRQAPLKHDVLAQHEIFANAGMTDTEGNAICMGAPKTHEGSFSDRLWFRQIRQGQIELAGALKAPVLGLYGAADQGIPVEVVEMFQDDLKAAKSKSEIVVYPDAPHGFHADYPPSYRQSPADDGWKKLLDWFRRHGVA